LRGRACPKLIPVVEDFGYFLLTSLKNFLSDEWDHSKAQKRGGDKAVLSLDNVDVDSSR
jgi:hypothetical protein